MPFENVTIRVRKDSTSPMDMWRQDATAGSVMSFSLSDTRGVHTYAWRLVGRPEGSGAGGGGPEPLSLGTSQTANITVDLRGAYIVECRGQWRRSQCGDIASRVRLPGDLDLARRPTIAPAGPR